MRVKLKTSIYDGPMYGTLGEALYFRYDESENLMLQVLFYGWPGLWSVSPQDVDSLHGN